MCISYLVRYSIQINLWYTIVALTHSFDRWEPKQEKEFLNLQSLVSYAWDRNMQGAAELISKPPKSWNNN